MTVQGVEIKGEFELSELERYVEYVKGLVPGVNEIEVTKCADGYVNLRYTVRRPFERIRRITGYLTGTIDRWNDAKKMEELDRFKHA